MPVERRRSLQPPCSREVGGAAERPNEE